MAAAAAGRSLLLLLAACCLQHAAAMHGFLDSLFHRGSHREDQHQHRLGTHTNSNLGKSVMDALTLAFQLGTAEKTDSSQGGQNVPNADKVFERYDTEGPTGLSYNEAERLLVDLGFNQEEVQQMQREMDLDRNGFIDKREFNEYIEVPGEGGSSSSSGGHEEESHGHGGGGGSSHEEQRMDPATTTPLGGLEQTQIREEASTPPPRQPPPPTPAWEAGQDYDGKVPPPVLGVDRAANTLQSVAGRTQDTLVDAVENAQVAEIKRSVFRSLARLRSAEIREYDSIARIETQAIDDYNDRHRYRRENPIRHMGDFDEPVGSDKYATFHSEDNE